MTAETPETYCPRVFLIAIMLQAATALAAPGVSSSYLEFNPCDPVSEVLGGAVEDEPGPLFCSKWNPDFLNNGQRCCAKPVPRGKRRRLAHCAPRRGVGGYCEEVSSEQKRYQDEVNTGKIKDVLSYLTLEIGRRGDQAYCSVGNGFLANGRMLIPTATNRVRLRSPDRCLNFGTDEMVATLEWLGREVEKNYTDESYNGVRLVVGDIAAPKGGCLLGRSGRRGHASHTTGQDADIGFLTAKPGQSSPIQFHRQFDAKTNWWFMKRIFTNPFACVKVIFLDRNHIRSLAKVAAKDPEWSSFRKFVRHAAGHRNHMHLRIGKGPGTPGCVPGAHPELEIEEDLDNESAEAVEAVTLDQLKSRQSSSIQE